MKYILLVAALFFSSPIAFSQNADSTNKISIPLSESRITYSGNISMDSAITVAQLFQNAENWYSHTYESADNTLTIDNINDGKISGTGIIHEKKKEHKVDAEDIFFTVDIVSGKGGYYYKVYAIYSIDSTGKFHYSDMYNEYIYPISKPKWSNDYKVQMLTNMNTKINEMIAKMQSDLQRGKKS